MYQTIFVPPKDPTEERLRILEHRLNNLKLMYRPPNYPCHINITSALDILYAK